MEGRRASTKENPGGALRSARAVSLPLSERNLRVPRPYRPRSPRWVGAGGGGGGGGGAGQVLVARITDPSGQV